MKWLKPISSVGSIHDRASHLTDVELAPEPSMTRQLIETAWNQHRANDWPQFTNSNQGQLMTLDTVISGCVVYYLDTPEGLDRQRVAIVQDCLNDLDDLTGELDVDSQAYFVRLRRLGEMLLATAPPK
jgi:hypothetical protein